MQCTFNRNKTLSEALTSGYLTLLHKVDHGTGDQGTKGTYQEKHHQVKVQLWFLVPSAGNT